MAVTNTAFSPIKMTAENDAVTTKLYVSYIRWNGSASTAAGHLLQVTDTAGNIVFESVADGPYFIDVQRIDRPVTGIKLTDLDSGTVYISTR